MMTTRTRHGVGVRFCSGYPEKVQKTVREISEWLV